MSIILKEIDKRQKLLTEYDGKVERKVALEAELAKLNAEIVETDKEKPVLLAEIKELTDCGIKLGVIAAPVVDESVDSVEAPVGAVETL